MKTGFAMIIRFIKQHMAWLLLLVLMLLADAIMLLSIQGPEEYVFKASTGEMVSISLPFDRVEGIAFSNNDVSIEGEPCLENAEIDLGIYDETGEKALIHVRDVNIHTNGFSNAESGSYEGLPCEIVKNKEYRIGISSSSFKGSLTIALYGHNKCFGTVFLPVFIGELLILAVLLFKKKMKSRAATALLMCGLALTAIVLMPALQTGEELQSFADVYSVSSKLLGKEAAEPGEAAFVYEDGLLNMGYSTYRVPVYRFWADKEYGNSVEGPLPVSLYVRSDLPISVSQLPALLGVTLARLIELSYRGVLLSGWSWSFGASVALIYIAVLLLRGGRSQAESDKRIGMLQELFMCIALSPSLIFGSFSFTGIGVSVSLIMLLIALLISSKERIFKVIFSVCLAVSIYGPVRFMLLVLKTPELAVIGNEAADSLPNGILKSIIYADRTMVELIAYRNTGYDYPVIPVWIFWLFIAAGIIGIAAKKKNNTILKLEKNKSSLFIFTVCSLVLIMFGYLRL